MSLKHCDMMKSSRFEVSGRRRRSNLNPYTTSTRSEEGVGTEGDGMSSMTVSVKGIRIGQIEPSRENRSRYFTGWTKSTRPNASGDST